MNEKVAKLVVVTFENRQLIIDATRTIAQLLITDSIFDESYVLQIDSLFIKASTTVTQDNLKASLFATEAINNLFIFCSIWITHHL